MANEENLKPWKPGQSGNPNGRPPKLLTAINKEMLAAGFERVGAANVAEAYELLLGCSEANLTGIINDPDQTMLMRIVAKKLLGKDGDKMIETILDRAHGKARQIHEGKIEQDITIDFSDD